METTFQPGRASHRANESLPDRCREARDSKRPRTQIALLALAERVDPDDLGEIGYASGERDERHQLRRDLEVVLPRPAGAGPEPHQA